MARNKQQDFEAYIRGEEPKNDLADFRQRDSMRQVLSTRAGRRFVYELLGVCHYGRSAFAGEAVHTTNALAGKQLVGEWAMGLLNLTYPEAFSIMVKEAKEDETNDRQQQQPNDADSANHLGTDATNDQPN